ncbi:41640_t:CDS:2, partial [Gigaspora margarita]
MVIRKLRKMKKEVDDVLGSFPTSQLTSYPTTFNKTVISFVVRKVMWYPVTPLIAQFFGSFVETYAYVNRVIPYPLLLLCCIGVSLQGLLNTLVFFQDIAVTRAFQTVKLRWWIAYVNYYESQYPHRSYNKAITDEFSMLEKSNDLVDLKSLNCNHTDTIKNGSVNDDIINDDIINDIIINNINSNSNNNNNRINNSVNNNNSISQPSLLEWLRYMILIKIFSAPKSSSRIISFKLLSPINSFSENKPNIPSSLFGKDDSKQDIILDSQNDQDIYLVLPESVHLKDSSQYSSLDLLSHCLNPSTSSDPLID